MTRGAEHWSKNVNGEKSNKIGPVHDNMNGYNRYAAMEMPNAVADNFNSLLRRISNEREKEQRLQACTDLRRVILEAKDFKALNREPFSILRHFEELLHTRMNIEMKREIAKCLGAMGYIMAHKTKDYVVWLFENYERSTLPEMKALYMGALAASYSYDANRRRLEDLTPKTLLNIQKTLERVESPQVLVATLGAVISIATTYPELFTSHFKDIVDIVVGWYVDIEQDENTLAKCAEALGKLQTFWLGDMEFTLYNMLTHLLEDAETYLEDMRSTNSLKKHSESLSASDCFRKSAALMKAFKTILSAISEYFIVTTDNSVYSRFVEEALTKLTYCVGTCVGKQMPGFSSLVESALESLKLFLDVCRMSPEMILRRAVDTCCKLTSAGDLDEKSALTVVSLVKKMITQPPSDVLSTYIASLIGPGGCLFKLRLHPSQVVSREVFASYKLLLVPRGVKCLQEVYRFILGEIVICFEVMHAAAAVDEVLELPGVGDGNPWRGDGAIVYDPPLAEAVVVYLSNALVELAGAKSSVIGMWALSPSLFQLLSSELPLASRWMRSYYPAAQYSLLSTSKIHCDKHDHFIANSALLADGSGNSMLSLAQSAKHFETIIDLVINLLENKTATDVAALSLRWAKEIVEAVNRSSGGSVIFRLPLFQRLFLACFDLRSVGQRVDHFDCVTTMVKEGKRFFTPEIFQKYTKSIIGLAFESSHSSFLGSLDELPITEVLKMDFPPAASNSRSRPDIDFTVAATNFDGLAFKQIMDFLLHDIAPSDDETETCPWTNRLAVIHAAATAKVGRDNAQQVSPSYLWNWAVWQTALYCVNSRLKTSLGKPQDTFLAIEGELKELANAVIKCTDPPGASKFVKWLRVQLLLNFVDVLEKLIYNAYVGTSFSLSAASKPVKTFFRTNKSTCVEWYNRIRIAAMTTALHNGNYAMVVRLGSSAFLEIEAGGSKSLMSACTEHIIPLVCQALLALKCSPALTGLYEWSKKYLNIEYPWIQCAADQAAEKYETAAADHQVCFMEERELWNDSDTWQHNHRDSVVKFRLDSMIDCYASLNDYNSMCQWMELWSDNDTTFPTYTPAHLLKIVQILDEGGVDEEDSNERGFDNAREYWKDQAGDLSWQTAWSVKDRLADLDSASLGIIFEKDNDGKAGIVKKVVDDLNEFQMMHLCVKWPEKVSQEVEIRRQWVRALKNETGLTTSDLNEITTNTKWISFGRLSSLHRAMRMKGDEGIKKGLCLPLSRLARKTSNFSYARKMLSQYAGLESEYGMDNHLSNWDSPYDVKKLLVGYHASKLEAFVTVTKTKAAFPMLCKTVSGFLDSGTAHGHFQQRQPDAAANVMNVLAKNFPATFGISTNAAGNTTTAIDQNPLVILSKCMSTLASWLEQDSSLGEVLLANEDTVFIQLVEHELQITERIVGALDADCVVGALLTLACRLRPGHCKSEAVLADWAYRTARKYIEGSSNEERVKLNENDMTIIEEICKEETESTKEAVVSLASTLRSDDGPLQSEEEIRRELQSLSVGMSLSVDTVVQIWQRSNYRIFLLYGVAADSYLKILHSTNQKPSMAVTAALRLLRLLVKHFSDLQHFVSSDFASVPARAWKDIIPQLFARLNHPSVSVRNVISATLCQIADSHPELVAFPAIVGSLTEGTRKQRRGAAQDLFAATIEDNALDESEQVDNPDDQFPEDPIMTDAYSVVVNSLRSKNSPMVDDIKLFIGELQRITLLREEVWLMALGHMEPEVTKRLAHLQQDIQATERNASLTEEEKESIILEKRGITSKMIFQTLTDLFEATSAEPQTANERHFFDQFCPVINQALTKSVDNQKPEELWAPFAKLLHSLYTRTKPNLDMKDISPVLADIHSSRVPMPGVSQTDNCVFIESVCREVTVLPTKTRPKKLRFVGSDGKRYTYLFKGLEDLHLDERMMQFLGICNSFFASQASLETCVYKARHYSVTPLGNRSGLIQWVENATPLFGLYKRWQLREASLNPDQTVTRPSDLFRSKLEPLLRRRNIHDLQNRHKWPPSALREVLTDLMAETPRDLLQKEFWCLSSDSDDWWTLTQQFARSTAVMSVIGYLIGLGDRHLDNVLVDLQTGEIVHIDYNVCFEKGIHLRVPERVPFRMTPNLKTALGPTGIEGTFRLSCEETLRFLRQAGESLLTLLEAFVYDPLVDWTTTHETGMANFLGHNVLFTIYGAARLEKYAERGRQLAYRLFVVRIREISSIWMRNKEAMLDALKTYHDHLEDPSRVDLDVATIEAKRHKAMAEHHKTFFEVRGLIKSLSKYEDHSSRIDCPFSEFMIRYKSFSESLTLFLKSGEMETKISLDDMSTMIHSVYDGLLILSSCPTSSEGKEGDVHSGSEQWEPMESASTDTLKRENQPIHQSHRDGRNMHALAVWRRVKMKLEGCEPDPAKPSTVTEQVEYIIRESTSIENLSLMYEGWMAWV